MSNYREMYICKFLHYKETINGGENINEIKTKVIIRKFYKVRSCFFKKKKILLDKLVTKFIKKKIFKKIKDWDE